MYNCKYCGKKTAGGKYLKIHENRCPENPDVVQQVYICRFCDKLCKNDNSLRNHERLCKNNPHKQSTWIQYHRNEIIPWNKGLKKETDERVAKQALNASKFFQTNGGTFLGRKHSLSTREQMSVIAKRNENEKHFGARHIFEYRGFKFISSYEVQVVKSLDENNIRWIQPGRFSYIDSNGDLHHYTPDIYLPDYDIYLDPKNDYLIENENPYFGYKDVDKIRWVEEQNNIRVIVLNKEQLNWSVIEKLIEECK